MVRSCARRSFAAETIFMALVICCVFLTERMRRRISIKLGMCLGQPLPDPAKPKPNRNAYSTQRRRDKRRTQCHGRARGGMGWAIRECDFDAETRRRGDRRREATRKRERARRQRRNVAFDSARWVSGEKTKTRCGRWRAAGGRERAGKN